MKHVLSVFALSALMVGSVACSSAPVQEESQAQVAEVAAEPIPAEELAAEATPAPLSEPMMSSTSTDSMSSTTSAPSDLSLGASSSGRGH